MNVNDTVLIVFTGVLTIAIVIQTFLFFGIYQAVRRMGVHLDSLGSELRREIESISARVDEGVASIKGLTEGIAPICEKLTGTTDIIHNRISEIDIFLAETTDTLKLEILRVRDSIESASQKVQETLALLHKRVATPLNEISAINRAVKVGMDVLFRRRRGPSSSVQDEEMFI